MFYFYFTSITNLFFTKLIAEFMENIPLWNLVEYDCAS